MQCQEVPMRVSEAEQTKPDWFYSDSWSISSVLRLDIQKVQIWFLGKVKGP